MSESSLVFFCTCHGTQSRTISGPVLEKGIAARRPHARVEIVPSLCRATDLDGLAQLLEKESSPAVLFAACSIFAKGRTVLDGLAERGCKKAMSLIDIRESCTWIHSGDREAATAKAVDLVCMGLAGLEARRESPKIRMSAERRVLVVGAGPAGLAAAGTLAGLGIPVTMVDRLGRPGGLLNQIGRLFPRNIPGHEFLARLLRDAANPVVDFLPKTLVTRVDGDPGGFEAHLSRDGRDTSVSAGAVILAVGAMPVLPENRFRSGELSGVISQLELETRLKKFEEQGAVPPDFAEAVFIQCMAARDDEHPYCSTICCPTALKNGLRLKGLKPDLGVTVLHRGIMTPGREMEELYRRAMTAGMRFITYSGDGPPEVRGDGRAASVAAVDALSGRGIELPADLVVLSTPLKPRPEMPALAGGLGVRLDGMGFACGSEPMQPLVAPVPGVYLCGAARWPVYAEQAVDQGRAAAVKAAAFLAPGEINPEVLSLPGSQLGTASILTEDCGRCSRCVALCPYGACRRAADGTAMVSTLRCRGCGLCAAVCPTGAARIPERNAAAFRAMLREIAPKAAP